MQEMILAMFKKFFWKELKKTMYSINEQKYFFFTLAKKLVSCCFEFLISKTLVFDFFLLCFGKVC